MRDNKDFRLGAYSGLLAIIMIVALTVMAFVALQPPQMQVASNDWVGAEAHQETLAPN